MHLRPDILRLFCLLLSNMTLMVCLLGALACRPTAGTAQSTPGSSPATARGSLGSAQDTGSTGGTGSIISAGSAASASYRPVLDARLCLDIAGNPNQSGEAVILAPCAPVPAQAWALNQGTLQTQGRCLTVADANTSSGATLVLSDCVEGALPQAWRFASGHVQLGDGLFCIALPAQTAQAGQQPQLAACVQNANVQLFNQSQVPTSPDPNTAARRIDIINQCNQSIYANDGIASFVMAQNTQVTRYLPYGWSGRVWARSDCTMQPTTATCPDGIPLTLAEFTFDGWGGGGTATLDYYDISLVDGFNITMQMTPQGGTGGCHAPICKTNILAICAADLQQHNTAGQTIACLSSCSRYHTDADCCQNANNGPASCPQPAGAKAFKQACPDAYSYAYDDSSSTWTCREPTGYTVVFCPP